MDFVRDPAELGSSEGATQRKAIRLFQMVWSGATKFIKGVSMDNQRPIELPGLGIFGPEMTKFQKLRDPLNKGIELKRNNLVDMVKPMRFMLNDDFHSATGLEIDAISNKRVGRYSRDDRRMVDYWFHESLVMPMSWASIARSCMTDAQTVEMVM